MVDKEVKMKDFHACEPIMRLKGDVKRLDHSYYNSSKAKLFPEQRDAT
jgi:hypothetical protein